MGANSKIEWCDHTFNAWQGCTKISPGCDNCYAESWSKRSGLVQWGDHPRRRSSEAYWRQPLKWNAAAKAAGKRATVFCNSLADWLDNQVDPKWRRDLRELVKATPWLIWLMVSKRIGNFDALAADWAELDNVAIGITVCNQPEAQRDIPKLLALPVKFRFLSCEPLLEHIRADDLASPLGVGILKPLAGIWWAPSSGGLVARSTVKIDWVICGGESGPNARPMHPDWARSIRDQCVAAGVPFFFKQWGTWVPDRLLDHAMRRGVMMKSDGTRPAISSLPAIMDGSFDLDGYQHFSAVGKKQAGALLDGREWRQVPEALQ